MIQAADNPPMLSPRAETVLDLRGRWWIAHTKARAEKAFARCLLARDIGYFLPMLSRVRIHAGRKRRVLLPLFSSYVFLCGREADRYAAMTTNHLCRTIPVADQQKLLHELSQIETVLQGNAPITPYPFAAVGQSCRIKAGPFRGLEGVVLQQAKSTHLILQVHVLGQGASLEIDADLLEPI